MGTASRKRRSPSASAHVAEPLEPRHLLAADLVGTTFNVSPDLIPGKASVPFGDDVTFSIEITVKNQNVVPFVDDEDEVFHVKVFLSANSSISTSDAQVADLIYAPLTAGQSKSQRITVTLSDGGAGSGNVPSRDPFADDNEYFLGMIIDTANDVAESNENNNANQGQGKDRDDIGSEGNLESPADGTVAAQPLTIGTPVVGAIGDEWIEDGDIDVFRFTATAGQNLLFDLDRGPNGGLFGMEMRLFDANWNLVSRRTGNQAPGEDGGFDAMGVLAHTFSSGGSFFLVLSNAANRNADPSTLSGRVLATGLSPGETGGYTLRSAVVPDAPGTPALLSTSDTGLSASDNVTRDTTPRFLVVGTPGGIARLYISGSVVAQDSSSTAQGVYLLTSSALTDAVRNVTATVEIGGQESAFAVSTTLTIDTTPPTAAATDLDAASDTGTSATDNLTADNTPMFTGTAERSSQVDLLVDGVVVGTTIAAATPSDAPYSVTPSAGIADGQHVVRVRVTDLAGNVSADSAALTVTIDTIAPAAPTGLRLAVDTGASNTDRLINDPTPLIQGSAEPGSRVTVNADGVAKGTSGPAAVNGSWSVTLATLTDGSRVLVGRAADAAGNVSAPSAFLTITVDTVPPATKPSVPDLRASSDLGDASTDNVTADNTPTFDGTAEPGITVEIREGTTVFGSAVATAGGTYSVTTSTIPDGVHALSAVAVDPAGNINASSGLSVTIDTVAPAMAPLDLLPASDSGFSDHDDITNVTSPIVRTSPIEANVSVKLIVDGVLQHTFAGLPLTSLDFAPTAPLADGDHTIVLQALDKAGNVTTTPAFHVLIDTTAPPAPAAPDLADASDSGDSSTDDLTNDTTPTMTGIATDGAVRARLLLGSLELAAGTVTAGQPFTLTPTTALGDARLALKFELTDLAGNVSALSPAGTIEIDTVGPALLSTPQFVFETTPQRVLFRFGQDVSAALAVGDFRVSFLPEPMRNPPVIPPPPVTSADLNVAYDTASNVATLTFPGLPGRVLPDGNWFVGLLAGGVLDRVGNPLTGAPSGIAFFALAADGNRDRAVDFQDLVLLAQNYNTSGKTYFQGDYSGDGTVDFNDLVILAQHYNKTLLPVTAPPVPAALAPVNAARNPAKAEAVPSLFSMTPVVKPAPVARPKRAPHR